MSTGVASRHRGVKLRYPGFSGQQPGHGRSLIHDPFIQFPTRPLFPCLYGTLTYFRKADTALAVKRHECLREIAGLVGDALVVVCVGGTSSEWNAYHPSDGNLQCWTLGLASSIALGMVLGLPQRRVIAMDGDGALLMDLCGLLTIMRKNPKNLS